ncbi:MAG: peroxiredoxin [Oscillatoriales cyanobacterium SM2_2_1]|nr:peroxiredoxin [Oscillatoriales cyanobacterium SM2_2_1]
MGALGMKQLLAVMLAVAMFWNCGTIASAGASLMPEVGQAAPEFTLPTNTGSGKVSLQDYRGQWVVLYFYPQDFTSGCTLEAQRFQRDLSQYRSRHVQILGVSVDSVDSHRQFCDAEGLQFPLLADEEGAVSRQYGSWLGFISQRHTFVIDPQGLIRARFQRVLPATHSQEVLEVLDALQRA